MTAVVSIPERFAPGAAWREGSATHRAGGSRPVCSAEAARAGRSGHKPFVDLRRLRMLSEIAGRGSFSKAAAALDYTPSAVSQQIALLEREAGIRLVDRGPRGARLTEAGRVLMRHADVALLELDKARRELAALNGAGTTRLRVAAFPTATATIVALAARSFAEEQGESTVAIVDAEPAQARALLAAGDVDAAVVYDFDPGGNGDLLGEDPVLLCLPAGHPLAAREEVELVDLAGERWFGREDCPWVPALVEQARAAGFTPTFSPLQSYDYAAMQGLAATHGLVGLIPMLALVAPHPGVVIRRLRPAPRPRTLRFGAAGAAAATAGRFRDHLRSALATWSSPATLAR
jgi:DNA-binding transcriptional LysR family regulator